MQTQGTNIIAISVGNTRTQIGRFQDGQLVQSERVNNKDMPAIVQNVLEQWEQIASMPRAAVALASVNDELAARLVSAIEDQLTVEVYRVGDDMPVPIGRQLDPETITGVDRLLNAAAAYDAVKQACVVVDAGTAVTVDFVDGEGIFQGGAIAPGATMQLKAMHQFTTALPELEFRRPEQEAFGRSTAQAMLQGVYFGIRGMVWRLVEQYAERYGAYPLVIVTGGDGRTLFEDDELVDRIVPELTLLGIAAAAKHALEEKQA
jgi:type III pantothenate kinase